MIEFIAEPDALTWSETYPNIDIPIGMNTNLYFFSDWFEI